MYVLPNVGVECNAPFLVIIIATDNLYGFMGVGPTLHLGPDLHKNPGLSNSIQNRNTTSDTCRWNRLGFEFRGGNLSIGFILDQARLNKTQGCISIGQFEKGWNIEVT